MQGLCRFVEDFRNLYIKLIQSSSDNAMTEGERGFVSKMSQSGQGQLVNKLYAPQLSVYHPTGDELRAIIHSQKLPRSH